MSQFISIANTKRLNPDKIINVYNRSGKPILRQIVQLNYSRGNPSNKDIHIRKHGNDYSQDFVDLLKTLPPFVEYQHDYNSAICSPNLIPISWVS